MSITHGDRVTIEYVGRFEDGTVFDTSREEVAQEEGLVEEHPDPKFTPLTIQVGSERVIEGLEEVLVGMEPDDKERIVVPPEKGYGEHKEDRIATYQRDAFDEMIGDRDIREGFVVETEDGLPGEVIDFDEEEVTIDFNHELAGETLVFDIEIIDVE